MENKERTKEEKCRFCHRFMGKNHDKSHCVVDGWEDDKVKIVNSEICEKCDRYKSKYIEYPLTIQEIENREIKISGLGHECGTLCEIQPCAKEYGGKSYLGIYLGNLPTSIYSSYDENNGILSNRVMTNPAILVPELKKIIFGYESWWREIKSLEDFKGITEKDIENTWYVQLLRAQVQRESND